MRDVELDASTIGGISEMAVELRMPFMLQLMKRYRNGVLEVDESDLPMLVDYLDALSLHLKNKYPNFDDGEFGYNEHDEEMYFDSMEIYSNPLKESIAAKFGNDFLCRFRC